MRKLNFGVLALIIGLTLAVTGSAFKPVTMETTYWFASNANGSAVGAYLPSGPDCSLPSGDLCALGFDVSDIEDPMAEIIELKPEVEAQPLANSDAEAHKP